MLAINQLSKTYSNGVKALDELTLEVGTGMFGLLGPNGAGKSTLMRTIATLQQPDAGTISFAGIDIRQEPLALRKILGYLPQDFGVYPHVSAEKLLDYFALLKGISSRQDRRRRVGEVLEITNLQEVRKKAVGGYSGGMKQRFGIAQLLLNNPSLLIVDEPTAGLDPAERTRFLQVIRAIATDNVVVFSTHIVDDVKDLCNDMAVISQGRVLMKNTPTAAIAALGGKLWSTHIPPAELDRYQRTCTVLSSAYNTQDQLVIRVAASQPPTSQFVAVEPTLEDVYFYHLGLVDAQKN